MPGAVYIFLPAPTLQRASGSAEKSVNCPRERHPCRGMAGRRRATFPNPSLTITVHEEDGEDLTDSARLPFTNICPEKAATAHFGALPEASRERIRRDDAPGLAASQPRHLKDLYYGKPPSRRAGRAIVDLGAVPAGRLGRQAGDDRPALRLDLDLGDRRRQARSPMPACAARSTASSRCSGRDSRWKSSTARSPTARPSAWARSSSPPCANGRRASRRARSRRSACRPASTRRWTWR